MPVRISTGFESTFVVFVLRLPVTPNFDHSATQPGMETGTPNTSRIANNH